MVNDVDVWQGSEYYSSVYLECFDFSRNYFCQIIFRVIDLAQS